MASGFFHASRRAQAGHAHPHYRPPDPMEDEQVRALVEQLRQLREQAEKLAEAQAAILGQLEKATRKADDLLEKKDKTTPPP